MAPGHLCAFCNVSVPTLPGDGRCSLCGSDGGGVAGLCRQCSLSPRPWFRGVTAFSYRGSAGDLLRRFKYSGQCSLAPFFAHRMAEEWRLHGAPAQPEMIVPVPLHWMRLCRRGFNQAALLAEFLGMELNLPVHPVMRRRKSTGHQARLDAEERQKNLRSAFSMCRGHSVCGRRILLLDDVFTTGATLSAATAVLLDAGATEVSVITAARA